MTTTEPIVRADFIGGADIAAILGQSPWGSPWSVWAEKVGLVQPTHDEATQDRLDAGKDAEAYLAAQFRRHEGLELAGEESELRHPFLPWARGHCDALVFDGNMDEPDIDNALGGWEAKTDRNYAVWDEVPVYYLCQIQWYMALTGLERWWVTVGFGGWRTKTYLVERDQSDIDYMLHRATTFWNDHVLTGEPPPTDGHPATTTALGQAWPDADDTLFADDRLRGLWELALAARVETRRAKAAQQEYDNALRAAMGDCATLADDGQVLATWKWQHKDAYTVEPSDSRVLLVKALKTDKKGEDMKTYTTDDKTEWGVGPWLDEPDKLSWTDETTGLPCLIVRNRGGALCGYVGVEPGHPWHGVGYSEHLPTIPCDAEYCYEHEPDGIVRVHGGLTYSAGCQVDGLEESSICHIPEPGRSDDVWWFGFDCAHHMDVSPADDARSRAIGFPPIRYPDESYKTVDYVRAEVSSLASQLAEVAV